jgi:adenosylhomocysteine nucleosidase
VAACAGAGQQAATRAFSEVEKDGPIDKVYSVGWAGALSESFVRGKAYAVSGVIDMRTGERFEVGVAGDSSSPRSQNRDLHPTDEDLSVGAPDLGHPEGWEGEGLSVSHPGDKGVARMVHPGFIPNPGVWVVTSPRVADAGEKQRLAAAYDAGLVEMEAAAVARLAAMRGIPFRCIKGVSDGFSDELPDFNRFISPEGQFQTARLLLFVLYRPWHWPALIRMGENSNKASRAIRDLLLENLDKPGVIENRNGDSNLKP